MASEVDTPAKPGKTGTWDNPEFLRELSIAFYQALEQSNGLSPGVRAAIPEYLARQGHPATWGAIR